MQGLEIIVLYYKGKFSSKTENMCFWFLENVKIVEGTITLKKFLGDFLNKISELKWRLEKLQSSYRKGST